MTPKPETIALMREQMATARNRGLSISEMRANAHKQAESLGQEIAATIVARNIAWDADLTKLFDRATEMREQYAAFIDLWYAEADETDVTDSM